MITRKLAKAILSSPEYGEDIIGKDTISWVQNFVYVGPFGQKFTKIYIYVNNELTEACDLSWIRDYANG